MISHRAADVFVQQIPRNKAKTLVKIFVKILNTSSVKYSYNIALCYVTYTTFVLERSVYFFFCILWVDKGRLNQTADTMDTFVIIAW